MRLCPHVVVYAANSKSYDQICSFQQFCPSFKNIQKQHSKRVPCWKIQMIQTLRVLHTDWYLQDTKNHIIRKINTSIWNGPVYLPALHKPQRYQANYLLVWTHIGPPDSTFTWGKAEYFKIERMQLCKQGYFLCVDSHKSVGNSSSTADEQIRNYSTQRCCPPHLSVLMLAKCSTDQVTAHYRSQSRQAARNS